MAIGFQNIDNVLFYLGFDSSGNFYIQRGDDATLRKVIDSI